MPIINKSLHRATVSLKIPAKVADFIAYATGIVHAMTHSPAFPAPVPALTALSAAPLKLRARVYRKKADAHNALRLKLYILGEVMPLSASLPVFENLGLKVIAEDPLPARPIR